MATISMKAYDTIKLKIWINVYFIYYIVVVDFAKWSQVK